MNTFSHRLIFNKSRGCLMAVAESARSCGAGSGGRRAGRTRRAADKTRTGRYSAALQSSLTGESFDKTFETGLMQALLATGAAAVANEIGSAGLTEGMKLASHAALGCVAGALRQGSGQGCAPGALGAAAGEAFALKSGEGIRAESASDAQADRKILDTANLVGTALGCLAGGAAGCGTGGAAAVNAVENNWLATRQKALMAEEYNLASSGLDKAKVAGKYALISGKQDALTAYGVGKGLADAGWSDIKGIAELLSDPVKGLQGLQQVITDPQTRAALGEQIVGDFTAKIDRMNKALDVGGDANAVQLGQDLGSLVWQVGSAVTGVAGAGKAGAMLAGAGVRVGAEVLDVMTTVKATSVADIASATTRQLNNFYRDGAPADLIQKTFNAAAISSTHNASASEVVLGRYIAGSADSYDAVAKARGATYFSMSDWSAVQGQLGQDQMWNINKAFLDQQIAQGKSFVFAVDPTVVAKTNPSSFTALEYKHLTDKGYTIEYIGGMYRAAKN